MTPYQQMAAALVVAAAVVAPAPVGAAAPGERPRPFLGLNTTLDVAGRQLSGTARWVIPNDSERPLEEMRFWLYPNRLGVQPEALGDVNFHWLYPDGFSPASLRIHAVRVAGTPVPTTLESSSAGADTIARVKLPAVVAPGAELAIELDFTTHLPERLGGFGCAGSQCRMMGGFYPFPIHLGPQGFDTSAAPDRLDFTARVVASSPVTSVLLGDVAATMSGGAVAVTTSGANAAYVTLVADRNLAVDQVRAGGVQALFFHPAGRRPPSSEHEVLPYVREDRVGLVLEGVRQGLQFLADIKLPRLESSELVSPIILVEAPLRHEMVQVHGNVILVSDRLFEIFPLERLRKFHRLELVRAVVTAVLNRALRKIEPDPDVDLATDVLALHLIEDFTLREFRRVEYARDLLRPLSFIPAVDQLIYAPLVASSSSYFGEPEDRDPIRDDLRRFSHRRGGGRLVHAKLLDLLGRSGMEQVTVRMLAQGVPFRQASVAVFGASLEWFWRQWLSDPPPPVNYRLERIRTTALPARPRGGSLGGDSAAVRVTIDVRREGAEVLEPVELRVVDRAGGVHDLRWNEPGPAHQFDLELPAGLASVELDPRHRLVESAVGSLEPSDDPLTDNRDPRSWRFIYSGAAALVDVTALSASFAAAVRVKPRHDLRNSVLLLAHHSPSTDIGVESAYTRLFGRQADRNRLTSAFGFSLSASLLNRDFGVAATEALHPRWRLTGSLFTEHDDRDYFIDPWRAVGMTADFTYSLTGLDSGERLSQLGTGIELLRLFELLPGHVLALDLQGGATFGDIRVRSQLAQIGGATGLRGYAPGELFGRGRVVGRVELRDRYVSDLDWNLAHFTSVRGFGGNVFFEAGLVTSCDDLGLSQDGLFYDVGYSLRILHDAFGVYQQLLAVDLAIPLNRHDRVCQGQHSAGPPGQPELQIRRPPFVVLISFLPTF